jgi:hypothetical protein
MESRCEIEKLPDGVRIRIRPERSILDAIVWPIAIVLIVFVPVADGFGWGGLPIYAMAAYLAWRLLWNLFGFEQVVVGPDALVVTKRMLLWCRVRRCEGANIDWIAYHRSAYRSPSGIGLMLKDKMQPFGLAYDLSPEDAENVLQVLKSVAPWLGTRVRLTSELSYYKMS